MGRRWIMVELGEHCHTHIIPRLKKVIDGEDQGGVTEAVGWKGGGGFRYYRRAPSLLEKDKWGNWVINKEYNPAMLAEAVCKLEGFVYAPSDVVYWQHGHSTEQDFIYVTTQNLSHEQLQQLSYEVGLQRTLLVMCTAFRGVTQLERGHPARQHASETLALLPNLTLKKIPNAGAGKAALHRRDSRGTGSRLRADGVGVSPHHRSYPARRRAGMRRVLPADRARAAEPDFAVVRAVFWNGARMPSMAEELATDLSTVRSRTTGSRR